MKIAAAVFVKTPGLSPVKTRLANELGSEFARDFFTRSCKAIEALLVEAEQKLSWTPYWWVKEREGLESRYWDRFGSRLQGEGGLGEKLGTAYGELKKEYDAVVFLGGDLPHLSFSELEKTDRILRDSNQWVIGPANDGGYYLFGGKHPLEKELWTEIPYSQSNTREEFVKRLEVIAPVEHLNFYSDVDVVEDLKEIMESRQRGDLPAQRDFYQWLEKKSSSRS